MFASSKVLVQALENRTCVDWTPTGTGVCEFNQRRSDLLEMTNLVVNVSDLGFGLLANVGAATPPSYPQTQKFLDLFEREPKLLSALDELQPLYGIVGENAISGSRSGRPWNQTVAFIVADSQRNAAAEKAVENQTKTTTQAPDVTPMM